MERLARAALALASAQTMALATLLMVPVSATQAGLEEIVLRVSDGKICIYPAPYQQSDVLDSHLYFI